MSLTFLLDQCNPVGILHSRLVNVILFDQPAPWILVIKGIQEIVPRKSGQDGGRMQHS